MVRMSVKYESKQQIEDVFNKILKELINSCATYEINIREERLNDIAENIDIKIRKVNGYE